VVELGVDVDLLVRVEPERDEVLLQLAHVEAVVDPVLERAPGRLAAREPEHGPRVDAVEDRAGAHERALLGGPRERALAPVGDRALVGEAERAVVLLAGDQVAALELRGRLRAAAVAGRVVAGAGALRRRRAGRVAPRAVGGEGAVVGDPAARHGEPDDQGPAGAGT